jgi:hypothetical protein
MITSVHRHLPRLGGILLLALAVSARGADVAPIIAPAKRAETVERVRQLLAPKPAATQPADPFFSDAYETVRAGRVAEEPAPGEASPAQPAPSAPKGDRGLLQSIASSLKPSGYFVLGGEPTLVFGQKRVKAGGLLTITFEGKEYTLEVTALNRTNFTLRLNREEFTRPIK